MQIEANKRFVWEVAGVTIDPRDDYQHHRWGYPWQFNHLTEPDHIANKTAHNLHAPDDGMPDIGNREDLWPELCRVRLSAHDLIPEEAHAEAEAFLEGLPRPIICLHSRGTNWAERKSLPIDVDHALIRELLQRTTGSVVVLDFDARAAMLCHAHCRGIKPDWGHIGPDRLCALFVRSDLLIGIDSGPFHLAAFTPVKALGVFRKLNPNHVCLPNPNTVYLVPAANHKIWERLDPHWTIREYAGDEPTAAEIADEAERMLIMGETPEKNEEEGIPGRYIYRRVGHDQREIELLPGNKIGEGRGDAEQRWFVRSDALILSGRHGIICDCRKGEDGVFRGRWSQFERMPIEILPVAQKPLKSRPTVTVVANWDDDFDQLGAIISPNRREYASIHGYRYTESKYPGSWGKMNALLDAWGESDWLWWLDADACVTDLDNPVDSLIREGMDFIVTCDRNGLNAGSFLVRCCPAMRSLFEEVLRRRPEFDWPNGLNEQSGLTWLLWKHSERVAVLPQRTINSYARECDPGSEIWEPGDFVLHCPSIPNDVRIRVLMEAVKHASSERSMA